MKTQTETGYCAADYTETDTYDTAFCGPIRETAEAASRDVKAQGREGVRYVHTDGYLYVDAPATA